MSATQFVVDNSVVMAWCFEDERSRYTDAVLEALAAAEAKAPAIWPLEAGNVLLSAERRGRLTPADVSRLLQIIRRLPITVEQEPPQRMLTEIIALAQAQQLSTYDASYLDLAMRSGLPIATMDKALVKAAKKCGVPVFDPGKPVKRG